MVNFVGPRSAVSPLALTVATVSFLAIGALGVPVAHAQPNSASTPPSAAAPANEPSAAASKGKLHHNAAAREATSMQPRSVERRIAELKSQLQITGQEENDWNTVADAMRQNAKAMEDLVQQTRSEGPRDQRTALQDLQTYQKFADAHADGLKRLTSAFETLYNAMSAEQKHHADAVFRQFERRRPTGRS